MSDDILDIARNRLRTSYLGSHGEEKIIRRLVAEVERLRGASAPKRVSRDDIPPHLVDAMDNAGAFDPTEVVVALSAALQAAPSPEGLRELIRQSRYWRGEDMSAAERERWRSDPEAWLEKRGEVMLCIERALHQAASPSPAPMGERVASPAPLTHVELGELGHLLRGDNFDNSVEAVAKRRARRLELEGRLAAERAQVASPAPAGDKRGSRFDEAVARLQRKVDASVYGGGSTIIVDKDALLMVLDALATEAAPALSALPSPTPGTELREALDALRCLDREGILNTAECAASGNPEWERVSAAVNAARAVIAKAEGRP